MFFQKNNNLIEQGAKLFVYTLSLELLSCVMTKNSHTPYPESEEQLVALLATLKVERVEEADFEGRFLAEFHERVAREAVCCPARRHLFAHLLQMMENIGRGRVAFGASALGVGLVAVMFALYSPEQGGVDTAAKLSLDKYKSPLHIPALSHDLADCTSVRVQPGVADNSSIMVTRGQHTTIIQISNAYMTPQRPVEVYSSLERNAAPGTLPASSVRYAF